VNDFFHTTRWSVVLDAGGRSSAASHKALTELCSAYWTPLYSFARRRGHDVETARDLTQDFFAAFLEKGWAREADPERGRFRAFLLTAFKRHLGGEFRRRTAQKRGAGQAPLSLDLEEGERRYRLEPAHAVTPDRLFDRQWALVLLERVLDGLKNEMEARGQARMVEVLIPYLHAAGESSSLREAAARLERTEGAVKVALHRLRKRYRERLRNEIGETLADRSQVDDEIRHLFSLFRD